MSEDIQCPLCLGYSDESEFRDICGTCVDNSASYDITKIERNELARAIKAASDLLGLPFTTAPAKQDIYEARGMLRQALRNCVSKDVKKIAATLVESELAI